MKTLYIIIARGGSKEIPRKNLKKLGGVPLLQYKISSAKKASTCSRLILSSEDEDIIRTANDLGVETPFIRPRELAEDHVPSVDVVLHAMDWIEKNEGLKYDAVMLLEPSTPFSFAEDYDSAVNLMKIKKASAVVEMRRQSINRVFIGEMGHDGSIKNICDQIRELVSVRRQDVPVNYTMSGGFYLMDWSKLKQTKKVYDDSKNTYGIISSNAKALELDSLDDWEYAEYLIEKRIINLNHWK